MVLGNGRGVVVWVVGWWVMIMIHGKGRDKLCMRTLMMFSWRMWFARGTRYMEEENGYFLFFNPRHHKLVSPISHKVWIIATAW